MNNEVNCLKKIIQTTEAKSSFFFSNGKNYLISNNHSFKNFEIIHAHTESVSDFTMYHHSELRKKR